MIARRWMGCLAGLMLVLGWVARSGGSPASTEPAPATLLQLQDQDTDPAKIDFESLPKLEGEHAVVCPVTDELKFQLHDYVIYHDGKYWCMFSHGPAVEDLPTQFVSYATSSDGLK